MINEVMTFRAGVDRDAAHAYLMDFANAEEWDPGTVRCVREDSGPIRVGSTWHNESRLVFVPAKLTFELTTLTPTRLTFTGRNDRSESVDDIQITDVADGVIIRYESTVRLFGSTRIATPLFRLLMRRMAAQLPDQMTAALERLPPQGSGTPPT